MADGPTTEEVQVVHLLMKWVILPKHPGVAMAVRDITKRSCRCWEVLTSIRNEITNFQSLTPKTLKQSSAPRTEHWSSIHFTWSLNSSLTRNVSWWDLPISWSEGAVDLLCRPTLINWLRSVSKVWDIVNWLPPQITRQSWARPRALSSQRRYNFSLTTAAGTSSAPFLENGSISLWKMVKDN